MASLHLCMHIFAGVRLFDRNLKGYGYKVGPEGTEERICFKASKFVCYSIDTISEGVGYAGKRIFFNIY